MCFFFLSFASSTAYFSENFDGKELEGWKLPRHIKYGIVLGKWGHSSGEFYGNEQKWRGLDTLINHRNYIMYHPFHKTMNSENSDLIIQYTARLNSNQDCSGNFIKILTDDVDVTSFGPETPFAIKFGPEVCGPSYKRTHFTIQYQGKVYENKRPIGFIRDQFTHAYTLVLYKNNSYKINIDGVPMDEGTLEERYDIPKIEKPEDWDEREFLIDENEKKPEDWPLPTMEVEEEVEKEIEVEEIVKPEINSEQNENDAEETQKEPIKKMVKKIVKETVKKTVPNPNYKEWEPTKVPNPNYNGTWDPPKFGHWKNLNYWGFEIKQSVAGSHFDNILVTDDEREAERVLQENFLRFRLQEARAYDRGGGGGNSDSGSDATDESVKDYRGALNSQRRNYGHSIDRTQFDNL
ncbi:Calreticulin family protein [Trichomonas vaginalis G3]|uniref:Calreticulin family protein n=1 Tax=Trichomonas vaginalis (strain ATCC PRA-98 / G3) TaxID=412133 RepID=A2F137_TRIV3|nr:unfolded protein binding [Trichomonas vaginalis G3]EAY01388.1 Calreticulin family protein [Trichomonas vaginalis G3]KAI5497462.1 unfolded protein binding [Trichomonas vaginalis G3]|eukprot:XP_001330236.1 Calreticulin family protein [Trichomonas vaginalis G3]